MVMSTRRDGHPNADMLAEKCRQLHGAEQAAITGSGMAALACSCLSQLEPGDHVVVSNQLYGRTLALLRGEAARLGITSTLVDTCDLAAVPQAMHAAHENARRRNDQQSAAARGRSGRTGRNGARRGAALLADNTLAVAGRLPAAASSAPIGSWKA